MREAIVFQKKFNTTKLSSNSIHKYMYYKGTNGNTTQHPPLKPYDTQGSLAS
jgi:hypothetical protein